MPSNVSVRHFDILSRYTRPPKRRRDTGGDCFFLADTTAFLVLNIFLVTSSAHFSCYIPFNSIDSPLSNDI